jgi:hypothetical protein
MPNRRSRKRNEKKQVGRAMLNWREMLSNSKKGRKCRLGSEIESSVGFSVWSGVISLYRFHDK